MILDTAGVIPFPFQGGMGLARWLFPRPDTLQHPDRTLVFIFSFAEDGTSNYASSLRGHLQRLGLFDLLKSHILRVPALFFIVATIADLGT